MIYRALDVMETGKGLPPKQRFIWTSPMGPQRSLGLGRTTAEASPEARCAMRSRQVCYMQCSSVFEAELVNPGIRAWL